MWFTNNPEIWISVDGEGHLFPTNHHYLSDCLKFETRYVFVPFSVLRNVEMWKWEDRLVILRDCTRNSGKNVEDNIVINSDNSLLLLVSKKLVTSSEKLTFKRNKNINILIIHTWWDKAFKGIVVNRALEGHLKLSLQTI